MACLPAAAVTTVALPKGIGLDYAKELYLGLREAADPFDCPIIGGDTASWGGRLAVTVTILGRIGRRRAGHPRRRTAPATGSTSPARSAAAILGRHMTFAPRIALAASWRSRAARRR